MLTRPHPRKMAMATYARQGKKDTDVDFETQRIGVIWKIDSLAMYISCRELNRQSLMQDAA